MAHIGSGVEYSLHCLLYLVERGDGLALSARDLAEFQGVSVSYVAKLFTKLEKAGLVRSTEGIRGGFQLARGASEISVLQVIDAVEGRKPLFDCKDIRAKCVLLADRESPQAKPHDVCSIHAVMIQAEQAMRQSLASTSLADIAARVVRKIPDQQNLAIADWFAERAKARPSRSRGTTSGEQN